MKIRTQFIINMVIFSAILVIVAFFVIYTFQQVDFINRQEDLARYVELGASNLNFYWNSYLLQGDGQNQVLWEAEYESFSANISELKPIDDEQKILVSNIRANQQHLISIYDDFKNISKNISHAKGTYLDPITMQESLSQMATYSQKIVSDSSQLSIFLDHHSDDMKLTHITSILILLAIFGAFLLTNYVIVNRRILISISELQAGTKIIGSGNLDFSLKEKKNDEIGELSRAFNQMTTNLKGVTASKSELEQEIAERKKVEKELRQRTKELEVANQEMEAFSYSVSHDLRAPLRSIDGFSYLILTKYAAELDEKGRDYLQQLRQSSQLMAQLIEDILNLYRVTRSEMHFKRINLSNLANEVAEEIKKTVSERNVEFVINPDIKAHGDELLLKLVLQNLLGNAFKFTGKIPKARIEFGKMIVNGKNTFYVRDNGPGFDMAFVDRLFKPFQRLFTAEEFPGTGIGLASVQRIIQRHGGRVWAEGKVNEGATFYFTLPSSNIST